MYYRSLKTPFVALLGTGLCLLPACQDSSVDAPEANPDGASVTVKLTRFGSASEAASSVDLFQFSGGVLRQKITASPGQSDPVAFNRESDNTIYAVAGYELETVAGTTSEEDVAKAVISAPADLQSAPLFFSASASLDSVGSSLSLTLVRGVARIDINNTDSLLTVKEVSVEQAAATSYIFPSDEKCDDRGTVNYSRSCTEGIEGLEKGVFTIFESSYPVTVKISGEKGGEPVEITAETPAINRNKVYTVSLSPDDPVNPDDPENPGTPDDPVNPDDPQNPGNGKSVIAKVTVSDWEDGGSYNPGPDTANGLTLDIEASEFPSNVTYDPATGYVEIPAEGIDGLRLAFRSDIRIDIDTITLAGEYVEKDSLANRAVTVKGYTMKESGNDVITTYTLKILPQLICRSEYVADLGIRKASMTNVYDHVKLRIAPHPKQIQTVMMGGHEWMCFNATTARLEDQIFPVDGCSIEEMYTNHFVDCIGNYFQFGKENAFSPWTSNDPNQFADQTRDIPWATPERMPLPEGYHVASAAEWKDLMPNGITLPAAWMTASGDSIKGSVVTLPGTLETPSEATNKKNYKMRYVLLESVTTGNKLYVPFGGIKSNNNAEVPGHGKLGLDLRASYWVKEDRYVWLVDYKATAGGEDGAVLQQNRWNYDGFMMVRGVKD